MFGYSLTRIFIFSLWKCPQFGYGSNTIVRVITPCNSQHWLRFKLKPTDFKKVKPIDWQKWVDFPFNRLADL